MRRGVLAVAWVVAVWLVAMAVFSVEDSCFHYVRTYCAHNVCE